MIYYLRDSNSKLIGLKYNDNLYYYLKNAQDDIIGLLDSNYNLVAEYLYDSWGNVISIKDNLGNEITDTSNIAYINPFRYRSYYYDSETKLYYLNSRYYNPAWGRFINADGIINADRWALGYNLYLYCKNNPIIYKDNSGKWLEPVINFFKELGKNYLKDLNAYITKYTQFLRPSASEMWRNSLRGRKELSEKTEQRLINEIRESEEFEDIIHNAVYSSADGAFDITGSSFFDGGSDLHLSIGSYS